MKETKDDNYYSNLRGISIADCISKIEYKFELHHEEISTLHQLKNASISGVFLTEEGSFSDVNGEYFSENIEGNGKVCIKYYDEEPYPKFLILKRIYIEKDIDLNQLYTTLETSIQFFEEAKRASKRMFFEQLFSRHQKMTQSALTKLNKTFRQSTKIKKLNAKSYPNQLLTLQRKGRDFVIDRAISLENKILQIIRTDLNIENQVLSGLEEDLVISISELKNIQRNEILH
ncbi:hypothetical protein [Zunongwangia sp. HGR-M22]|uniref:hypothetical protein n=1 Tax=Zunongwangia sp. HGR-M22 TaxID=3015168 RepID=UPI0022DE53BA|nr:hypothetical protein [Zunongwangia sp. HGR-M22]WBL25339.1 hypothetical protein PBT91_15745 [Zunongwangia sp. HGR-M22]